MAITATSGFPYYYRFNEKSANSLVQILDLGEESFSSIALWHGDLYLGSSNGQIYMSKKLKE